MSSVPVAMGIPIAQTSTPDYPSSTYPSSTSDGAKAEAALHDLHTKGWPLGLCNAARMSLEEFPLRIWVVDNSGSMQANDGSRFVQGRKLRSTRWQELGDTVLSIAELTTTLGARTDFHFLNPQAGGKKYVSVGSSAGSSAVPPAGPTVGMDQLRALMSSSAGGGTPLAESVNHICDMVERGADKLRAHGQRVVVVLATDGLPNNKQTFLAAMQRLQRLPVWVVVRLCTNDDSVTDYYSDLDKNLEAPLEVLDDICGEAAEVRQKNGWLAYGPPLHQLREWGLSEKLFDLLDEQALIPSQLKQFVEFTLGCKPLPEPELDMAAFTTAVGEALKAAPPTFDPLLMRPAPWFDLGAINRHFNGGGCTIL